MLRGISMTGGVWRAQEEIVKTKDSKTGWFHLNTTLFTAGDLPNPIYTYLLCPT